jgi:hypothetical protein
MIEANAAAQQTYFTKQQQIKLFKNNGLTLDFTMRNVSRVCEIGNGPDNEVRFKWRNSYSAL